MSLFYRCSQHVVTKFRLGQSFSTWTTVCSIDGPLHNKPITAVVIGDFASTTTLITDEKVRAFAALTGDNNPIHLDDEAAQARKYERRIAHGMLVASAIPALFAKCFPLCVYRSQELQFTLPVYVEDMVKTTITVATLTTLEKKRVMIAKCDTRCQVLREDKLVDVIKGVADVIVPQKLSA